MDHFLCANGITIQIQITHYIENPSWKRDTLTKRILVQLDCKCL
jgi:hypothetical protein